VKSFTVACNIVLERERSGYRFVDKVIIPNPSKPELEELEEALNVSRTFSEHLKRALELFADRQSPDYRNSIKESISAVEALCQLMLGDQKVTLGDALKRIENKIGPLHPAFREALNKLYGFTSDAQGIRHALLGQSDLDVEDARFMLIVCSAFINYLASKASKAGLKLQET